MRPGLPPSRQGGGVGTRSCPASRGEPPIGVLFEVSEGSPLFWVAGVSLSEWQIKIDEAARSSLHPLVLTHTHTHALNIIHRLSDPPSHPLMTRTKPSRVTMELTTLRERKRSFPKHSAEHLIL